MYLHVLHVRFGKSYKTNNNKSILFKHLGVVGLRLHTCRSWAIFHIFTFYVILVFSNFKKKREQRTNIFKYT